MDVAEHRAEAVRLYGASWELLENDDRTDDDDAALLTSAFASRYHWTVAGGREQWIIADWMVSRAASALRYSALAVDYAMRSFAAAQEDGTADWLVASAAEGVARAYAAAGDSARRDEWCDRAATLVAAIADAADRSLIEEQLASVPR